MIHPGPLLPPQALAVIRFNCPHCGRHYELPEALARLSLVCKGCGQPLPVPETSTAPEPPPPTPPPLPPSPPPSPPRVPEPKPVPAKIDVQQTPLPPARPPVLSVATAESRLPSPEKPHTNGPPSAYPMADELFETPDALEALDDPAPAPPPPPAAPRERKLLGAVVDVLVALGLVAIGVFCGELLARQSTTEVLKDAASAAKFPPVDLLMWLTPTVLLLLVYALFISRGKSAGGFLRRRAEV